ncbi:MAG: pilus assembly protein PilB [Planctomycetota bacterium]|nr:MAG: pilus assembly protein PilB [Planctomycetota bacterium]
MEEVDKDQAQTIYRAHRKEGKDLYTACLDGGVREEALIYCIAASRGMEMVQLDGMTIPDSLINKIEPHIAHSYRIIPVRMEDNDIVIATSDPDNLAALDDLKFMLGVDAVKASLTSEESIDRALGQYYEIVEHDQEMESFVSSYQDDELASGNIQGSLDVIDIGDLDGIDMSDAGAAADAAPVRKLLNLILLTAVKAKASDVHFEPFEDTFQVRNRIDGVLYEMLPVPKNLAPALVARIKVMSRLDIAERRVPQDGKISVTIGGRNVDLRVSTLPTMFGESVVIRILDRSVVSLDLDKIGMEERSLDYFRDVITRPNGIVVVTGPTGSGKTTTLYAALNEANDEAVKIITTEDPVEYEIDGLIQVPIDDEIGKTFAACLRSILRQDPDKILVGEVRDRETAKIAIEASLTGHIVFTTLHTNDAPTAVTRLLDMGLEPFLIAATLETIIAQRLVRTICSNCKAPYQPSEEELLLLGIKPEQVAGQRFFYGKGCEECKGTGYRGRTAIFEILEITPQMRELILEKASSAKMRAAAERSGMVSLRQAGIQKVFAGVSTIEEVVRETLSAED